MKLTQKYLKELLYYNPDTGIFTWKENRRRVKKGDVAGGFGEDGYIQICIDRFTYRGHQLAWLYHYGEYPCGYVDHINHNRSDNSISNLRCVTAAENGKNRGKQSNNKSGYVGVHWDKTRRKWLASIKVNRRCINLGRFKERKDAIFARQQAENKYGFHSCHGK